MTHSPITVLMPVYNSERYVARAGKSILDQTFRDFEFLVINDGSTDRGIDIIREFDDPCIRVIDTENQGVCSIASWYGDGESAYIARMDADDERLQSPGDREALSGCASEVAIVHGSVQYWTRRLAHFTRLE